MMRWTSLRTLTEVNGSNAWNHWREDQEYTQMCYLVRQKGTPRRVC